jgi:TonB family protein
LNRIARTALILSALIAASSLGFAQSGKQTDGPPPPAAEYNQKAWKEFSSVGGRFSVLLPGVPSEEVRRIETALGPLDMHAVYLHSAADYAIFYADYPQSLEDPSKSKQALDGARDEGVRNVKGRVLEEKDITLEAHPGRYLRIEAANGLTIRSKLILVGSRLYNLAVFTYDKEAPAAILTFHEEVAVKFLNSFGLLPETESTAQAAPQLGIPDGVTVDPALLESQRETNEKPAEGEVDRLLKSLREKGELVLGYCKEGAKCEPLPDIEGVTAKDVKRGITIKVINKPPPVYPPIARAARAQGSVVVQVVVDEEGKVIAAQAVSGYPLLQAAAVKAARELRVSPVLLGTKPVKVSGVITYNFVLQ